MKQPPPISPGDPVQLSIQGDRDPPRIARVASIHRTGLVLRHSADQRGSEPSQGTKVRVTLTSGRRALGATGVVAGSSPAGIAVQLDQGWRPVERRSFPRVSVFIPMRYRLLGAGEAKGVAAAIRSRVGPGPPPRSPDLPSDRRDLAALHQRLMRIERTLQVLTDLVLGAGDERRPLIERELELSASGLAFTPDEGDVIELGHEVELDLLLPLRDPVRVRATATAVRRVTERDRDAVAFRFECLDESDQDEIARYVFLLQRRRVSTP